VAAPLLFERRELGNLWLTALKPRNSLITLENQIMGELMRKHMLPLLLMLVAGRLFGY